MNTFLGKSKEEVVALLGTPIREELTDGKEVVSFGSKAPVLADYYIFDNGHAAFVSKTFYSNPKVFIRYIGVYGNPDVLMRRFEKESIDSGDNFIAVWASKGVSVSSDGVSDASMVLREDAFYPMSVDTYLSSWGKAYVQYERLDQKSVATIQNQDQSAVVVSRAMSIVGVGIIVLMAFFVFWMYLKKIRKNIL